MPLPDVNISSLLVILFGGGGIIGGLVAFLRYRREADSVIATAAEKTVKAQGLALENLEQEVKRLTRLVDELKRTIDDREKTIKELSTQLQNTINKAKDEIITAIH